MTNLIVRFNEFLEKKNPFDDFKKNLADTPQLPVIFIAGLPRSGTTPLAQMLIQRFRLGYVSNLVARFWNAPELGIAVVKEISADPGHGSSGLQSDYGFTSGYEGHHEFGYFWRRWFNFDEIHYLDEDAQSKVDVKELSRTLSAMESLWQRPLIFKNPAALPLQTAFLAKILPTSLFVYIKREQIPVAVSLYNGREKYMGDVTQWFSVKPREYAFLKEKNIPEQIAGQIYYTQKEMEKQLEHVPDHRKICLPFSDICADPDDELNKISKFLKSAYAGLEERIVGFSPLSPVPENIDGNILRQIETGLDKLNREKEI
jgi:hypothetical protein